MSGYLPEPIHPNALVAGGKTREGIATLLDRKKQELVGFLETEHVSADGLETLRVGLAELQRATSSPEALAEYCRTYVLGPDLDVLRTHEHSVLEPDTDRAKQAHTEAAAKKLATIRELLQKILDSTGALADLRTDTALREINVPELTAEELDADERAFKQSIAGLRIPEAMKDTFFARSLIERQKTETSLQEVPTPAERLQQQLDALMTEINHVVEQILLNTEIAGVPMNVWLAVSDSPAAKILHSAEFNTTVDLMEQKAGEVLSDIKDWSMNATTQEKVQATILATLTTAVIGGMAVTLSTAGPIGAAIVGAYVVSAAGIMSLPMIRMLGKRISTGVQEQVETFQRALDAVTTNGNVAAEQTSASETDTMRDAVPVSEPTPQTRQAARATTAQRTL